MSVQRGLAGALLAWMLLGLGGASAHIRTDAPKQTTPSISTQNSSPLTATPPTTAPRLIVVGGDHNYPPYEYLENGNPTGFNIELIQAIAGTMGFEVEVRLAPWNQVRRQLEQGEIDMLAGMYFSEVRAASVDFSLPHTHVAPGLFVRVDSAVKDFEDARGLSILVQQNDIMHEYLEQTAFTQNIFTVSDPSDALQALAAGEYDAALLSSQAQGWYFIDRFNITNLRRVETGIPPQRYCFAVQKGNNDLLQQLNEGLNVLNATGEYHQISERWFGVYEQRQQWQLIRYYLWGMAGVAALLLLSLFWSRSLRSQVRRQTEALRKNEEQLAITLNSISEAVIATDDHGNIIRMNPAAEALCDCAFSQVRAKPLGEIIKFFDPDTNRTINPLEKVFATGESNPSKKNLILVSSGGRQIRVTESGAPIRDANGNIRGAALVLRDVSEEYFREEVLRASEEKFSKAFLTSPVALSINRLADGLYLEVSDGFVRLTGYSRQEVIGKTSLGLEIWLDPAVLASVVQKLLKDEAVDNLEIECRIKGGGIRTCLYSARLIELEGEKCILAIARDISDRKQAESQVIESQRRLDALINNLSGYAYRCKNDPNWTLEYVSQGCLSITGYRAEELSGDNATLFNELIQESDRAFIWETVQNALEKKKPYVVEYGIRTKSGEEKILWEKGGGVYDPRGRLTALEGYVTDITERKQTEVKLQRQLNHLAALRAIDQAIASSVDLRLTLRVLLDEVIDQLDADACAVLLTRLQSQRLEYVAQQGFRFAQLKEQTFLIGEGYAGGVALKRQPLYVVDLQSEPQDEWLTQLAAEGFVAYYATPLIAKGNVKGVLEIFKRKPFTIDAEWKEFLKSLTGQAALAIDNATLFENLQHSNIELSLAYDATIEGWSHALELRDHETEGHSHRVVELTLKIARAMGVDEQELVHIRRGALLHDIGKMGIPDSILLKPGPLTPTEWKIMKNHPLMAERMLGSVAFLKPALDIPRYHHERWDGGGYPYGLKGEQIPPAARIFTIVDVWDALQHDRPYRKAWDEEKIWDYIQEQSGKHFDPQVVEYFRSSITHP